MTGHLNLPVKKEENENFDNESFIANTYISSGSYRQVSKRSMWVIVTCKISAPIRINDLVS